MMLDRRAVLAMLAALFLPARGGAQSAARMARIGVLAPGRPEPNHRAIDALKRGLHELGYVEGQSIAVEVRWAQEDPARFPQLAADLVRLKVDAIVAPSGAIPAARSATTTIPIVMATAGDPVEHGWVASLARPGGNVTGVTLVAPGVSGKRLELFTQAVPSPSRIAALWNQGYVLSEDGLKETETAARKLGVHLMSSAIRAADDLEPAFQAAVAGRARGVIFMQSPLFTRYAARIAKLGLTHRMPTMSGESSFADEGGLMNYGPSIPANWHRTASFVDRILKGAKAGDLPVEQPARLELVVNANTARALGLTLPPSLLISADRIIER